MEILTYTTITTIYTNNVCLYKWIYDVNLLKIIFKLVIFFLHKYIKKFKRLDLMA